MHTVTTYVTKNNFVLSFAEILWNDNSDITKEHHPMHTPIHIASNTYSYIAS